MGVLKKREIEVLKQVKTTKKQAKQILRRNKPMLAVIEEAIKKYGKRKYKDDPIWDGYEGDIGCPHCTTGANLLHPCNKCSWNVPPELGLGPHAPCLGAGFGGVSMNSQLVVEYDSSGEFIWFDACSKDDLKDARKFLKGHIEWAQMVLDGPGRWGY